MDTVSYKTVSTNKATATKAWLLVDAENETVAITRSEDYESRREVWLTKYNHNYLRLTRILKCLMIFDLEEFAEALYECLQEIYDEEGDKIGAETFQYWTDAVNT